DLVFEEDGLLSQSIFLTHRPHPSCMDCSRRTHPARGRTARYARYPGPDPPRQTRPLRLLPTPSRTRRHLAPSPRNARRKAATTCTVAHKRHPPCYRLRTTPDDAATQTRLVRPPSPRPARPSACRKPRDRGALAGGA